MKALNLRIEKLKSNETEAAAVDPKENGLFWLIMLSLSSHFHLISAGDKPSNKRKASLEISTTKAMKIASKEARELEWVSIWCHKSLVYFLISFL